MSIDFLVKVTGQGQSQEFYMYVHLKALALFLTCDALGLGNLANCK
jgi:hypothetical protein